LVDRLLSHLILFICQFGEIAEPDAEEIASDVLWSAHQSIQKFRYGGSAKLTTWIFEIAKNRAIDFLRKAASSPEYVEVTETASVSGEDAARYAGKNKELLSWLNEQLSSLREDDQNLLKWRALGFAYAQIASWLGISEVNARVRYKRALDKLINAGNMVLSKDTTNE